MEEISNYFEKLGLTKYESLAMSALFNHHNATADEISKIAEIPYTKIYAVLVSLEKSGLVKTTLERPKRYSPLSPDSVLSSLLQKKQKEIEKIKETQNSFKDVLENVYSKGEIIGSESNVIYLPTNEAVYENVLDVTKTCKKNMYSVAFASMWDWFVRDKQCVKYTFDFTKRGIETKNIIPSDFGLDFSKLSKDHFKYFFLNKINFKILDPSKIFYGLMINDNREATIWFHDPTTKQVTSGIVLKNKDVVSGMMDYYNVLWNTAKPLSTHIFNLAKQELIKRKIKL